MNIAAKFWDRATQNFDQQEARYQHLHSKNTETIPFNPTDDPTYIVGCFIDAQKSVGQSWR